MSIYVVADLETTGHLPDKHAILSIGAVAIDSYNMKELSAFSRNVSRPHTRDWDPDTVEWWKTQPEAQAAVNVDPVLATDACANFIEWLRECQGPGKTDTADKRIVFVANPIAYDLPFLRSYMLEFANEGMAFERFAEDECKNKKWLHGIDMPTLAMGVLDSYDHPVRRTDWSKHWTPDSLPHTHVALDDARLQAHAFVEMMQAREGLHKARRALWRELRLL